MLRLLDLACSVRIGVKDLVEDTHNARWDVAGIFRTLSPLIPAERARPEEKRQSKHGNREKRDCSARPNPLSEASAGYPTTCDSNR